MYNKTYVPSAKPPRAVLSRDSRAHVGVRAGAAAAADDAQVAPQVVRHLRRAVPPPRARLQARAPHAPQLHRQELLHHRVSELGCIICTLVLSV